MTWPEAFKATIDNVCWTFLAWRVGAGVFEWWRIQQ